MRMRNLKFTDFFLAVFLVSAGTFHAQNKLYVNKENFVRETFDLQEVKKIVFTPGKFILISSAKEQEYLVSDVRYLSFYVSPSSLLFSNEMGKDVNVFPNPVTDEVIVESDEPVLKLLCYDLQGKILRQVWSMASTVKLETSDLPVGNYILQIITSHSSVSKKIIKK